MLGQRQEQWDSSAGGCIGTALRSGEYAVFAKTNSLEPLLVITFQRQDMTRMPCIMDQ